MSNYVYFVRGARHAALCRTSMESVRKVDKDARCIVMTDDPHERDWHLDNALTYYIKPGMPIMLANLEAQVAALFVVNPDEPVFFLDTDILLLEKIPVLADLTVTWRDHVGIVDEEKVEGVAAQMPYNYGVIAARWGSRAVESFIFMRERIRRMHSRYQEWYGNQLALAELCGPRPETGETNEYRVDERPIPWMLTNQAKESVRIAKIPAEKYNYTPQRAGEGLDGKAVLHFKGGSRALMESYAKRLGLGWYAEPDKNTPTTFNAFQIERLSA